MLSSNLRRKFGFFKPTHWKKSAMNSYPALVVEFKFSLVHEQKVALTSLNLQGNLKNNKDNFHHNIHYKQ